MWTAEKQTLAISPKPPYAVALAPAQAGFGLLGPDCRSLTLLGGQQRVPLLSIVYPTEAEAEAAREAITAALATAIAVVTPVTD